MSQVADASILTHFSSLSDPWDDGFLIAVLTQ
jgi:hypothetical protein